MAEAAGARAAGASAAPDAGGGFALPARVRDRLVELAAAVLGELDEPRTPPALARVRLFAPARRARAGAAPLALALDRDAVFRAAVAAAWRGLHPALAAAMDAGNAGSTADADGDGDGDGWAGEDPAAVLAGLYLLRPPGWELSASAIVDRLARAEEERARQGEEGVAAARVRSLERELERTRAELASARIAADAAQEELASARRELRRLRADADRARAAARAAVEAGDGERARAAQEVAAAQRELDRERDRARQAVERAEQALRAGREGRSLADARLRLLLDTVVEAATGLRRELALAPLDVRPADVVGAAEAGGPAGVDAARGQAPDDPARLADLLALPQAHLVVDGYNVTKAGYGTLPLVEQRRRLVDALAPVAARTGAEVTVVFDGAETAGPAAQRLRGVRVLFSEAGTTADELVRRLVRAEPSGRPVVVVSSDKEVASGVRAAGARPVPAAALLRLLARA
ncbi:MAG TPA: NYN domain-containing protein [Kineosporiaceae bacterium]|nr:NYN domain-containing protein [Kineosporiaceae bacterium]